MKYGMRAVVKFTFQTLSRQRTKQTWATTKMMSLIMERRGYVIGRRSDSSSALFSFILAKRTGKVPM